MDFSRSETMLFNNVDRARGRKIPELLRQVEYSFGIDSAYQMASIQANFFRERDSVCRKSPYSQFLQNYSFSIFCLPIRLRSR